VIPASSITDMLKGRDNQPLVEDPMKEAATVAAAIGFAIIDDFVIFEMMPRLVKYAGTVAVTLAGELGEIGPEVIGGGGAAAPAAAAAATM